MVATPKYKAKAVYFDSRKRVVIGKDEAERYRVKGKLKLPDDISRFDSQHEFKVYLELCRIYGAERVVRQCPVRIYPPGLCYPKGKTWKIDFGIACSILPWEIEHYVEAKGAFLPEFAHTLASLETLDYEIFHSLYLVFPESIPKGNRIIRSLTTSKYQHRLLTLEELSCLRHLPLPL
jgi:hypothetical protein